MGVFDKAKLPSEKAIHYREREAEQEERIRRALVGLRNTYSSKTPLNMMLQGARGAGGTGSYRRETRTSLRNLGSGFKSAGLFGQGNKTNLSSPLAPGVNRD